jgi:glycosyltransferase involved in cell wall biosynthesis
VTRRVTVIHPWLPQYRLAFFAAAIDRLADAGVELTVAHGDPPPDVARRGDDVTAPWAVALPTRAVHVGGRALLHHRTRDVTRGRDLVIVEHAIRNLESYPVAVRQGRGGPRLALWGHGRTYTKQVTGIESRLKNQLARRAHWFFAYTAAGAAHVAELGVDPDRITVVQNSVDTEALAHAAARVTPEQVRDLQRSLDLTPGRTALYLGALDPSKRLDVLLDAAALAARTLPGFALVVAGSGPMEQWLRDRARTEPWLRYAGPVFGDAKAELASAADIMVIAGRVGLVAVDSFALKLPIVTCDWALHAPEFEYLVDGVNASIVPDTTHSIGQGIVELLQDPHRLGQLRSGCARSAAVYTLEAMTERFCAGVVSALAAAPRGTSGYEQVRPDPLLHQAPR